MHELTGVAGKPATLARPLKQGRVLSESCGMLRLGLRSQPPLAQVPAIFAEVPHLLCLFDGVEILRRIDEGKGGSRDDLLLEEGDIDPAVGCPQAGDKPKVRDVKREARHPT